jgi:hypothetical protein
MGTQASLLCPTALGSSPLRGTSSISVSPQAPLLQLPPKAHVHTAKDLQLPIVMVQKAWMVKKLAKN